MRDDGQHGAHVSYTGQTFGRFGNTWWETGRPWSWLPQAAGIWVRVAGWGIWVAVRRKALLTNCRDSRPVGYTRRGLAVDLEIFHPRRCQ